MTIDLAEERARAAERRERDLDEARARALLDEVGWKATRAELQAQLEQDHRADRNGSTKLRRAKVRKRIERRRERTLALALELQKTSESRVRRVDPESYLREEGDVTEQAGQQTMSPQELRDWTRAALRDDPDQTAAQLYERVRDRAGVTRGTFATNDVTEARKDLGIPGTSGRPASQDPEEAAPEPSTSPEPREEPSRPVILTHIVFEGASGRFEAQERDDGRWRVSCELDDCGAKLADALSAALYEELGPRVLERAS